VSIHEYDLQCDVILYDERHAKDSSSMEEGVLQVPSS